MRQSITFMHRLDVAQCIFYDSIIAIIVDYRYPPNGGVFLYMLQFSKYLALLYCRLLPCYMQWSRMRPVWHSTQHCRLFHSIVVKRLLFSIIVEEYLLSPTFLFLYSFFDISPFWYIYMFFLLKRVQEYEQNTNIQGRESEGATLRKLFQPHVHQHTL